MSAANVNIVQRAFTAFNAGDPSVWLGLYDPDIVLVVAPRGGPEPGTYVGAAAVERWFTDYFRVFGRSFHVELLEVIPVGDSVVTVQRNAARGELSGAQIEVLGVGVVITFRGGRIIRFDFAESRDAALRLVSSPT
jgi:ketosteroid isomerase-like protein